MNNVKLYITFHPTKTHEENLPKGPLSDFQFSERMKKFINFFEAHSVNAPKTGALQRLYVIHSASNEFHRSSSFLDPSTAPPFFSLAPNIIGPPSKWSREREGTYSLFSQAPHMFLEL